MRTTNKEFKAHVQEHVIDCLCEDYTTVVKEQLENVVDEFNSWYCAYEQRRHPNKHMAFKDYLLGLPTVLSVEYTYYNIGKRLEEWFTNCGERYVERDSDKEADLYYHLVVREFSNLCKQYDVKF